MTCKRLCSSLALQSDNARSNYKGKQLFAVVQNNKFLERLDHVAVMGNDKLKSVLLFFLKRHWWLDE
jgi:hypothetical protein